MSADDHRFRAAADPRHLPAFLAVCEAGSVHGAARLLHRTQPAVSYQIRQLQRQLGVALFERVGRRLKPTAEGEALHRYSAAALGEFVDLGRQLTGREVDRQAPIRLASVTGFGRYVLVPRLVRRLRQRPWRNARLEVVLRAEDDVYGRVLDGHADAGFVFRASVSHRMTLRPAYREEFVLIAPPAETALFPQQGPPGQLESYVLLPWITYEEGEYLLGAWFEAHWGRMPDGIRSAHHLEDLEEVHDFVAAGHGVAVTTLDAARALRTRRPVRLIRPSRRHVYNQVFVVTRATAPARPVVEELVASIMAAGPPPPRSRS